jgi:hypothetical protein
MDEQYRMLGRERQADLEREARRFAQADRFKRDRVVHVRARRGLVHRVASMLARSGRTRTLGAARPGSAPTE